MTIVDVLWLVGLIAVVAAASGVHLSMASVDTPRRRLRLYLMWSAVGASAASFLWICLDHGADAALLAGALFGPVCQPLTVTYMWVADRWQAVGYGSGERMRDDDWMQDAFWRRGRGPPPRTSLAEQQPGAQISDDAWMESAFWRQDRERPSAPATPPALRPASPSLLRTHVAVTAAMLVTWPLATILGDVAREPRRREAVVATLEALGFESLIVVRSPFSSAPCFGGVEYDWRADSGDGRACVRDGDYVTLHFDHDHISKEPFARPAS